MDERDSQYIVYKKIDLVLAILLFIGCVCYLPMLLGVKYISIGMGIFLMTIFVCIVRQNGVLHLTKKSGLRVYITAMLLFLYCLVQSIVVWVYGLTHWALMPS